MPGIGVGIVVKDKLVFAKGYGFRDFGKKLPVHAQDRGADRLQHQALHRGRRGAAGRGGQARLGQAGAAVRAGHPVLQRRARRHGDDPRHARRTAPGSRATTRSGTSRTSRGKELFERLKYLEPTQPLRQTFLYNNMMYAGAGYVVELLSGKTWEDFVRERIFTPLGMTSTVFSIDDMLTQPEHGVPFTERRDSFELYAIPYYREAAGIGPAGLDQLEPRGHVALADRAHERRQARRPAGDPGGGAQGDARARDRARPTRARRRAASASC